MMLDFRPRSGTFDEVDVARTTPPSDEDWVLLVEDVVIRTDAVAGGNGEERPYRPLNTARRRVPPASPAGPLRRLAARRHDRRRPRPHALGLDHAGAAGVTTLPCDPGTIWIINWLDGLRHPPRVSNWSATATAAATRDLPVPGAARAAARPHRHRTGSGPTGSRRYGRAARGSARRPRCRRTRCRYPAPWDLAFIRVRGPSRIDGAARGPHDGARSDRSGVAVPCHCSPRRSPARSPRSSASRTAGATRSIIQLESPR
ncbi:hypothetical protein HBB16_13990 [Pseudonocardia sp. MCCB 268]|nr:hypothetical protein [Pseudonocardia cytotoxica]